MKPLLTIIFLFAVTVNAQTVTPTQLRKSVDSVRAIGTAAISAQAKAQAVIDARQDSAYKALPTLDTNTIAKVRGGKVVFMQDAAIPILQNQAKATASQITTLQAQTTSQQVQLNSQAGTIATLQAQLAALQIIIDKLKAALQ